MHTAQLMPLPLTVSFFSKIQIGFTFLVPAHPGSHGKRAVKLVCVCFNCQTTVVVSVIVMSLRVLSETHRAFNIVCGQHRCLHFAVSETPQFAFVWNIFILDAQICCSQVI